MADVPAPRVLVAGVGNIFLGDDAFGSEVARQLAREPWPDGVRVVDYGVSGIHLAYDLLDGYERLVLVDAVARGGEPGTVTLLEVDPDEVSDGGGLDAHSLDPHTVLRSLRALGGRLPRTLVLGCEPADTGEGLGLSPAVSAAVEATVSTVVGLLRSEGA